MGKAALDKAIDEKRDVPSAFHRKDIGEIDLIWGIEGDPNRKFKGGKRLSHVIAERTIVAPRSTQGETYTTTTML